MKHFSYLLAIIVAGTLGTTTLAQARGHGDAFEPLRAEHRHVYRRRRYHQTLVGTDVRRRP